MNVKLIVVGGMKAGMEVPISRPKFLIGRGASCDIQPQSKLIGQVHCQISVGGSTVTLEDCGGAIGTLVNGKRVRQQCGLQDSDRIKIGPLEFEVRMSSEEADARKRRIGVLQDVAIHNTVNTDIDSNEAAILKWVKPEEKPASSPPRVVTLHYADTDKRSKTASAATDTPDSPDADIDQCGHDFGWNAVDLLLMSMIGPLMIVLFSCLPTIWMWRSIGGFLAASLAFVLWCRSNRPTAFVLDELSVAVGVLAIHIAGLVLPAHWAWRGGVVAILIALVLSFVLRKPRLNQDKWKKTDWALWLSVLAILVLIIVDPFPSIPWLRLCEAAAAFIALNLVSFPRVRQTPATSREQLLLRLTTMCILLTVIFGWLYPIWTWWPAWMDMSSWTHAHGAWRQLRFRLNTLWYHSEMRWGIAACLAALLTILFFMRAQKTQ